ncbi:hypothetical protein Ahy_A03g012260 [Arachis hypogaea]|uniref:Uncharacterized protein n=1 Tax=Arachis hypogaea TaxID=3818 RepID=A0A445DT33_ARAHY|nr:hypothetical protein Ahy_A03g012260 [Arachis hypogaea]
MQDIWTWVRLVYLSQLDTKKILDCLFWRVTWVGLAGLGLFATLNGRHTCTMGTISQDHSKLDSDIVAEAIRPLVETDPSIKTHRQQLLKSIQSLALAKTCCQYRVFKDGGGVQHQL